MEEYARFVLDDALLVQEIKDLRHELRSACESGEWAGVIRGRDITGDVGCEVEGDREYARSGTADVVLAAGKRLSEALRVIEEYGKTVDPVFARRIERLRYQGYEIERRLAIRIDARHRFEQVRLYVLLTEKLCHLDWLATARAALDGGADCLQLREKDLPDRELADRARRLVDLCRQRDVLLIINDRPDIAVAVGADGVHLGQDDLPIAVTRRIVGTTGLVGVSTHTIEQASAAADESPDYIAVGPMFASVTKPQDHIAGPETLAAARRMTSLPLVAIGGIDADNVGRLAGIERCCMCVCSAVISRQDPAAAAAKIREQLEP